MKKLSRREFIKAASAASGAAILAACAPQATPVPAQPTTQPPTAPPPTQKPAEAPTQAPQPTAAPTAKKPAGTVVVMHQRNELSEDEQKKFEADNPGIKIDFVQNDTTRRTAMFAAGTPPDFFRTGGGDVPIMLLRKQILDLTSYIQASPLIKVADLAPANYQYFAEDAFHTGSGKIYGMAKDWSAAMTLFVNTEMLKAAGFEIPSDEKSLTYAQLGEMARKCVKKQGDRTLVYGYGGDPIDWSPDTDVTSILAEQSKSTPNPYVGVLYDEKYTKINLTNNEPARQVFKWFFDLQKEGVANSPVNPSSEWTGKDFCDGKIAIVHEGYWFGQQAGDSDAIKGKVKALPSARFFNTGKGFDWTTATGDMIAAASKVPDAAFRVFEWYHAQEPGITRAKGGWGVPALKSQYALMPSDTDFNKQRLKALNWELANVDCQTSAPPNPWAPDYGFLNIWNKYLEPVLRGQGTFDDLLAKVETEISGLMLAAYKKWNP